MSRRGNVFGMKGARRIGIEGTRSAPPPTPMGIQSSEVLAPPHIKRAAPDPRGPPITRQGSGVPRPLLVISSEASLADTDTGTGGSDRYRHENSRVRSAAPTASRSRNKSFELPSQTARPPHPKSAIVKIDSSSPKRGEPKEKGRGGGGHRVSLRHDIVQPSVGCFQRYLGEVGV